MSARRLKIGITIGDFNGIGLELILKTFSDNRMLDICTPVIFGSSRAISYHKKALNIDGFNYNLIRSPQQAKEGVVNLINCWNEEVPINLGKVSDEAGRYAFKCLELATDAILQKQIDAIVTAPLNKHTIKTAQPFTGHTEYLAQKANTPEHLMLLTSDYFIVGLVTGHIPINKVAQSVTTEKITQKLELLHASLIKDFRIDKPKIAILGLNPHAGENGTIGSEEKLFIIPAIEKANANNIMAFGPYPADGFWASGQFKQFDAILAMYHDQGLIPFKTLCFDSGVNYTAGLPFVRTSPDHGTAYDIAGKGIASEESFREAVLLAIDIYSNRAGYNNDHKNPVKKTQMEVER